MLKFAALLAGLAAASAATAGPSETLHAAGLSMQHAAPAAVAAGARAAIPLAAGTVIYSNFNSDQSNLYDCCNGYTVRGEAVGLGYQRMAMPFTPATDTHLRRVFLAISHAGGINRIDATLQEDDNGVPGNVIRAIKVEGFPELGTCCDTESIPGRSLALQAGKTYWIVVTPKDLSALAWNNTNTGGEGNGAFDTGSGWQTFTGMQSAFAVIGD